MPLPIVVLISGTGSNLRAVLGAIDEGRCDARVIAVISDRESAKGLDLARDRGIATAVIKLKDFAARELWDAALTRAIAGYDPALIVLAGFMKLLGTHTVARFPQRIINIHPALLPAFKGLDTHRRALESRVERHGATVHFVVPEMDSGPIILQGAVSVHPGDSEEALAARVLKTEHRIYPLSLKLLAEGRVKVVDGHCLIDGLPVPDSESLVPDPT